MEEKSVEVLTPRPGQSEITKSGSADPANGTEQIFAEVLAEVVSIERVSVDSHFFNDLGANSLVMAQFCARVRKRDDLPSVSMKDVYKNPTIRSLASALMEVEVTAPPAAVEESAAEPATEPGAEAARADGAGAEPGHRPCEGARAAGSAYVLCGTAQFLIFLGYCFAAGTVTAAGYGWVSTASGALDVYLRSMVFGSAGMIALCTFPIVAKWLLIGRWKPREFPVWGLTYLRFWTVKVLIHASPMVLLVGNPLYVLYLRALGAKIGKNVTLLSRTIPVCTDLLTIGEGTVVRKDSFLLCYRAHAGLVQTGPITLGRDVLIGEKTVLDIDTSMGDGAQLGHSSALQRGEHIPHGEHWHGSPAERTEIDYLRVAPAKCGTLRRAGYGLATLLQMFLLYVPLGIGGAYILVTEIPSLGKLLDPGASAVTSPAIYIDALVVSLVLFGGFVILGLAGMLTVPRMMNIFIKPDKVYPLYGFHYSVHRTISRFTNIKFFKWLFGDSSYIVYYLKGLGYDLSRVEQTGSNFGTEVQHETPFLSTVGSGTMIADGLSVVNADFSSTSFRVSRATIGAHNFFGNNIAFPSGARTGENCLLATKVMVPLDGEIREGVGLLGSPCFEIPRSVERDSRFDHLRTGDELHRQLGAKNRYNLRSMALMLSMRWFMFFVITLIGLTTVDRYGALGQGLIAVSLALVLAFTMLYLVLVERVIGRFRPLEPQLCSIYDPYFWWHERLWKVPSEYFNVLNGTPFKNVVWRLLGVRIGKRVFDDGALMTERTLTTIGDDCTLNAGSKVQCHSQEDGTFKSDYSVIGSGSTLGVGAHVHYGVSMGDGAVLAADSFLMKGEEVPAYDQWGGNPAAQLRDARSTRS
ncbi:Pls/PosA family non-ribosomal peptide synthetase [Streptomyces sp. SCSIO 30461]|uniref:Pls/PosA family non-ribosomal peptide synthetase n=1 Tax=Streptomyces sp. SCSIO 30461 TaxID=3118085 RepID=UPI0030CDBA91